MGEIFFVIKMSIVTVVFIFLMQIKIGDDTLENHAMVTLRGSQFSQQMQELGAGGWKELRKQAASLARSIGDSFGQKSESRLKFFGFGRSQARVEEETRNLEEKAVEAEEKLRKKAASLKDSLDSD